MKLFDSFSQASAVKEHFFILDDDGTPTLNLILKADVDGTLEALLDTLDTYDSKDCKLDLVHYGVGPVVPNDIELAQLFDAVVYAFNVDVAPNLKETVEQADVPVKQFNVIYKLIDDVKEEINGRLPPKEEEEVLGEATVLQQFEVSQGRKKIPVAGCRCEKGVLKRTALFKVVRNGEVIHSGESCREKWDSVGYSYFLHKLRSKMVFLQHVGIK